MIRDFAQGHDLPAWDICIAGAGPAGIILALKLGAAGFKVGLLEGGGLSYSEESQRLYAVKSTGMDLFAASTRLRYFGGTSNHWSGRCRPFDRDDFERAPKGGLPGWPIPFDEFNWYLPEAMDILDLPAAGFRAINEALPGPHFEADRFALSPPTRFAVKYLETLRNSRHIDLVLNCNLVDVLFDAHQQRVTGFRVVNHRQQPALVKSGRFVLAMGAIENVRLLLNSASLAEARVVSPMLGKAFMEHLNVELGTFILNEGAAEQSRQYYVGQTMAAQKGVGKGNVSFNVLAGITSYGRTAAIKNFFKNLACNFEVADKVQFVSQFNCPGTGVISTLVEQFPSRVGSHVSLAAERDALGLRKAHVHWALSDFDRHSLRMIAMQVAKDFASAGTGFVKLHQYLLDEDGIIPVSAHAHHMGGTRMAKRPGDGVVDANARVFHTRNLYIAGSSIFSTGGGGNPTMPIIQLTLRLADHLRSGG